MDSTSIARSKTCNKCKVLKPIDDFGRETRQPDGRRHFCRSCLNGIAAEKGWHRNRHARDRQKEGYSARIRERNLKLRFGIDNSKYEELLLLQQGACAICQTPAGDRMLAVDHCHDTAVVRGLLCTKCNVSLGILGDSEVGILRVLAYLRGQLFDNDRNNPDHQ